MKLNTRSGKYGNVLHAAVCWSREEIVLQLLLDSGAAVNAECDSEFSTALQAACYRGKVANVKYLLDNAADPNILGGWYGNALQIAVAFHGEIAKPLLERCADINAKGGLYSSVFEAANGDFGTNQE